jgi:hypothetical protein
MVGTNADQPNIALECESPTAEWEGTAGWFVGRDCSAPGTLRPVPDDGSSTLILTWIMPLKTRYGYYIHQVLDSGDGSNTACPEDMYC